jgi:hypothetical protein
MAVGRPANAAVFIQPGKQQTFGMQLLTATVRGPLKTIGETADG